MKKYETLKLRYPEHISLEQLRLICKISKRSAKFLVDNGIIPSTDTGKKTWKYKISIDDVITYLRRREQWGRTIPKGKAVPGKTKKRISFSQVVKPGDEQLVEAYFSHIYKDSPDVLCMEAMAEMTGLSKKTIQRIVKSGHIKYLAVGRKYLFPKVYFLEFIASERFICTYSNSERFLRILRDFEEWERSQLMISAPLKSSIGASKSSDIHTLPSNIPILSNANYLISPSLGEHYIQLLSDRQHWRFLSIKR